MDFVKVLKSLEELLAPAAPVAPEAKVMKADEFAAYAKEQVSKADAEVKAGKVEEAKKRVEALKAEVEKVSKFEYKDGELPSVSVFRDAWQNAPTEAAGSLPSPAAYPAPTFKALSLGLDQLLADIEAPKLATEGEKPEGEELASDSISWPSDLTKADVEDADHWGLDPK